LTPGALPIQEAYTQWSATYDSDRNLTRDLDQQVTQASLAALHCHTLVELGCGTGKNTALLAQIGRRVCALDFSVGMLGQAKEKLAADNVTFTLADLTRPWPCARASVDLIVCNLVLEHIQDLAFIFAEAAHTLASRGRFFICELHPFRQYQGSQATYSRGQVAIPIQAFVHHLSDFIAAAEAQQLALSQLKEWWHADDQNQPPRLVSLMFEKRA